MKMKLFVIWFLSFLIQINSTIYRLNDEDYELMPSIVQLDPFEQCLRRPRGRYCTAHATFVADEYSPLLNQLKQYSAHTASRFNHTRSLFGTCLTQKCAKFYDNTTTDLKRALEACLNQSLWETYNLKVKVDENMSCHEYNEMRFDIGAVDIAVAGIILALVVCNAVGSIFYIFGKKQDEGPFVRFLLCFSIPRNWNGLVAPPGAIDARLDSFKGIYGVRAILTTLVIAAHAMLPVNMICGNPKFVEDRYEELPFHIILNGTLIMQTFLFLSALLLVYHTELYAEQHQLTWRRLPFAILKRWLRLTPSYAIVLAITATWMKYVGSGPIWDILVVSEAEDCRQYWWKHLLYFNNYDKSRCMPQAWYLATDIQLHCLGLVIVLFCRTARCRKVVLPLLFFLGVIIPGLHTYYQDLDATLIASPSATMDLFHSDRTFNEVYSRGHTNIASYVLGMAFGYLVYQLQRNKIDAIKYRKWCPLYWLLPPACLSMLVQCHAFYRGGARAELASRTLLAALIRPVFGLVTGLIIVGIIFKVDKQFRELLEWRGWTSLGRLSYSAYLLHVAFIRVGVGAQTEPFHASYRRYCELVIFMILVTYASACLFWITVEAPLGHLARACLDSSPGRAKSDDDKKTDKTDTKL